MLEKKTIKALKGIARADQGDRSQGGAFEKLRYYPMELGITTTFICNSRGRSHESRGRREKLEVIKAKMRERERRREGIDEDNNWKQGWFLFLRFLFLV